MNELRLLRDLYNLMAVPIRCKVWLSSALGHPKKVFRRLRVTFLALVPLLLPYLMRTTL